MKEEELEWRGGDSCENKHEGDWVTLRLGGEEVRRHELLRLTLKFLARAMVDYIAHYSSTQGMWRNGWSVKKKDGGFSRHNEMRMFWRNQKQQSLLTCLACKLTCLAYKRDRICSELIIPVH